MNRPVPNKIGSMPKCSMMGLKLPVMAWPSTATHIGVYCHGTRNCGLGLLDSRELCGKIMTSPSMESTIEDCRASYTFGLVLKSFPFPHFWCKQEDGTVLCVECWKTLEELKKSS